MRTKLLVLTIVCLTVAHAPNGEAKRARCADLAFQEDAQAFMQRQAANYLDRDKDGVACEVLPRRGASPSQAAPSPKVRLPRPQPSPSNR
jgi:hypothetical protein